jgi:hypothetical protein
MEELHHTHKEVPSGWVLVLADWRRSLTRRRLRAEQNSATCGGVAQLRV